MNIDWSSYLRLKQGRFASRVAPYVLRGERRERFLALSDNVMIRDLRRGIPFQDESVDAVYHSHVLEHFDRDRVPAFLSEIRRVLRKGGVHRIAVPDFEAPCRRYLAHLDACAADPDLAAKHDEYVSEIVEQMVRREATGTSRQPALRRAIENAVLGDARRRGETHQWMYDQVNLSAVLTETRFRDIRVVDFRSSSIPGWADIRLDQLDNGEEYIPGSLYVEALK